MNTNTTDTRPLAERITPGPVTLGTGSRVVSAHNAWVTVAEAYSNSRDGVVLPAGMQKANAELIVETFNICHETGKTPRELAEALRACPELPDDWDAHNPDAFEAFTEAFTEWRSHCGLNTIDNLRNGF